MTSAFRLIKWLLLAAAVLQFYLASHVSMRSGELFARLRIKLFLPSSEQSTPPPEYAYLLAWSNHKTGTYQLRCLGNAIANATNAPMIWKPNRFFPVDVANFVGRSAGPRRPPLVSGGHPPQEMCFATKRGTSFKVMCPRSETACDSEGVSQLSLNGCLLPLLTTEAGSPGVAHFHRSPWDVVTSALWYHRQRPVPYGEGWLKEKMSKMVQYMVMDGVPRAELDALGVTAEQLRDVPYAGLLRHMPQESAVQLQFWQSAPELYKMARQYRFLKHLPGAVQIRFEDAQRNLSAAVLPMMSKFYPNDVDAILRDVHAHKCDPSSWSEQDLNSSNHVTATKHPPGTKERLHRVLWQHPAIRRHLCTLSAAMDYESPLPCDDGDAAETLAELPDAAATEQGDGAALDRGTEGSSGADGVATA